MAKNKVDEYNFFCTLGETIWQISSPSAAVIENFAAHYSNFAARPCASPHCRIEVTPGFVAEPYMNDHGIPRFEYTPERVSAFHSGSYDGYYSLSEPLARFTIATAENSVGLTASYHISICNIIRLMMMIWLPHYKRLLVHSAALIFDKKGYLFMGMSGRGKSTLAELFAPDTITGDVTLLGESADGRFMLWPTFIDQLKCVERFPDGYPLEKIYLLDGHRPYSLAEIPTRAARMKAILENSVGISWQQADEMLSIASSVAANYPIKKLTYVLENGGAAQKETLKKIILRGSL